MCKERSDPGARIDHARTTIDQQGPEAPDAQGWLAGFAAEVGTVPPTQEDTDLLLELAKIAAHSAERQVAPLTCWLAARAGASPQEALAAGKRLAAKLAAGSAAEPSPRL